jgi:hypothetical protein
MIFKYIPSTQIMVDNVILKFGEQRDLIRVRLAMDYKEKNRIIQINENDPKPIHMRRDIYQNDSVPESLFFLNYSRNDLLSEVEVHSCESIVVLGVSFGFDDNLDSVALALSKHSEITILSEGEIFFIDLKMVISDKRKMGGEGDTIGYFYCASDVTHIR